MNRVELIAMAIRAIGPKMSFYRTESSFEALINTIFEQEPREMIQARQIDSEISKATNTVKRISTNRKFKKIVSNV